MPNTKKLSVIEFNEKYRISILTEATVDAELIEGNDDELDYGTIEEMHDNVNYIVYDRETLEEVLNVDIERDADFIDELRRELNVDI